MPGVVIVAGGGTAGHLYPGLAIAHGLLGRGCADQAIFVGTERGLEARLVPRAGLVLETIHASGAVGLGLGRKFKAIWNLFLGYRESRQLLRKYKPRLVLGVGGYASLPMALASRREKIPLVVQEQNVFPGVANRLAARFSDQILLPFEGARSAFKGKGVVIGNPVRREVVELAAKLRNQRPAKGPFTLLVFGGSLGARFLNQVVPQVLAENKDVAATWRIIHQTGENDFDQVCERYRDTGLNVEICPFLYDMGKAYGEADLALCRSGASTLAELAAVGLPSVLVPFPNASHDHQTKNALLFKEQGAAVLIPQNEKAGGELAKVLKSLSRDPKQLETMARCTLALGQPKATDKAVDLLERYFQ